MKVSELLPGMSVEIRHFGTAEVIRLIGSEKVLVRLVRAQVEILVEGPAIMSAQGRVERQEKTRAARTSISNSHTAEPEEAIDPNWVRLAGSGRKTDWTVPANSGEPASRLLGESIVREKPSSAESELIPEESSLLRPSVEMKDPPKGVAGNQHRRQAIEALRFGVVPNLALRELTLGYEELRNWVNSRLPSPTRTGVMVSDISGPFGNGKTHAMAVVRQVALSQGYAVARAEVDGRNVTLADPQRLLHSLLGTLETRDGRSSDPVLDIYLSAIDRTRQAPRIAPRGIDRTRDNYNTVRIVQDAGCIDKFNSDLECVLSGGQWRNASDIQLDISREPRIDRYKVRVRRVVGHLIADRPYDFVEALLGLATICELAGYSGLVLTIDEFEVEDFFLSYSKKERVRALLDVLQECVAGKTDHASAPLALFFASVGLDGHVGDQRIRKMVKDSGGDIYWLDDWAPEALLELGGSIGSVYADAYGIGVSSAGDTHRRVLNRLDPGVLTSSGRIRAYIKQYVRELDTQFGPPK